MNRTSNGNNNDVNNDNDAKVSVHTAVMVDNNTASTTITTESQFYSPQSTLSTLQQSLLVIATRIHLGESSSSSQINTTMIQQQMKDFYNFCYTCHNDMNHSHDDDSDNTSNNHIAVVVVRGVIAVDVTHNNDLLNIVRTTLDDMAIRTSVVTNSNVSNETTRTEPESSSISTSWSFQIDIIPVQPWGKFTPALNALLSYAADVLQTFVGSVNDHPNSRLVNREEESSPEPANTIPRYSRVVGSRVVGGSILYCSLETTKTNTTITATNSNQNNVSSSSSSSCDAIRTLFQYMDYDTTLVCGAVLSGHDYRNQQYEIPSTTRNETNRPSLSATVAATTTATTTTAVPTTMILNGRTSPWNTFALWNINKLSKIGFVSVSEGLHVDTSINTNATTKKSIAGIEEVATIALLQKLYNPHTEMMAKLISLSQHSNNDGSANSSSGTSSGYQSSNGGILWDTTSTTDIGRQQWHEYKMQSKLQRAQEQLQLLSFIEVPPPPLEDTGSTQHSESQPPGIVYHY